MNREEQLNEILRNPDTEYDIIVAGGGATGLGIALDGVLRGYKTLLLEKNDFANGTSSRSTKLVHGGVRYLQQGDVFLVREALHERSILLRNAPHLTFNQEFIIPVYTLWDVILYTVGLTFYDFLSGSLSLGRSSYINKEKTINKLPLIKQDKLKGGIAYRDGQFDDSRMAVALAEACVKRGGKALNYFGIDDFIKDSNGNILGVKATDSLTNKEYLFKSKLVINATGVFANELVKKDNPSAKPILRPSQGVHVVLDKNYLESNSAIMIPKTDDGRVLFTIPWYDKVVVGTTDTPLDDITLEPKALDSEVDFILKTFNNYLTKKVTRDNVLSIYAGLRPLAHNPDKPTSTKEISRRHKIIISKSGLLTIIGGKWTTYRCMAEEAIDAAIKARVLDKKRCITKEYKFNVKPLKLSHEHLYIYGLQAETIEHYIKDNPSLGETLSPCFPYTKAEIIWICRNEMPVNIDDILARRTRALLLNAKESAQIAPVVARIMADEFGHDQQWIDNQLTKYNNLIIKYI